MTVSIRLDGVDVRIGQNDVLRDIRTDFAPGTLTGIIGPNGAGKTTMMRAILGLLPQTHGSIDILGTPLADWRRPALARAMAYLPQGGDVWPMRAFDIVLLGRLPHRQRFLPPTPADIAAVEEALIRCDAQRFRERDVRTLSSGERARVLLARTLATRAPILLADEPAAFLDPAHQFALMELLRAEAERGSTVIVTLHDLALAEGFCDHLLVLKQGQIEATGPAATVLSDDVLARVFALRLRKEGGRLSALQKI